MSQRFGPITAATDLIRVRIAAETHDIGTKVQQKVIRVVLADDQVPMRVIKTVAVDVMYLGAWRQWLTKNTLGN